MKQNEIKEILHNIASEYEEPYLGIYFKRLDKLTVSANYVSKSYKLIFALFFLYTRIRKRIFKYPISQFHKKVYHALYQAHYYGMFIYQESDRRWVDHICQNKNINDNERILLAFGGAFNFKKRSFPQKNNSLVNNIIYIFMFISLISHYAVILVYALSRVLVDFSSLKLFTILCILIILFLVYHFIIHIMKICLWDINALHNKYY